VFGALPSTGLVVKRPIPVPLERNGTKRAGDEESTDVDEIEVLACLKR